MIEQPPQSTGIVELLLTLFFSVSGPVRQMKLFDYRAQVNPSYPVASYREPLAAGIVGGSESADWQSAYRRQAGAR